MAAGTVHARPSLIVRSLLADVTTSSSVAAAERSVLALAPARKPRPRKEEIIAVAKRLFAQNGYELTTIDEIAGNVGLLKGSLYHHIASKSELLGTIVGEFLAASGATRRIAAEASPDAETRLQAFVTARRALHLVDRQGSAIVSRSRSSLAETHLREVRAEDAADERFVSGLLAEGESNGSFRSAGASGETAKLILSLVAVPPASRRVSDALVDAEAVHCADFVLAGLKSDVNDRARRTAA